MTNWPIGLSTGCFYRQNILECLEIIRAHGFSMIEVCFSPAHLNYRDRRAVQAAAERIEQLGMEAYSFHAPFADDIDISALDPARREDALQEILRAAEAAAALRVHYFVIHPGPEHAHIPPQEERLQRMENTVGILNRLGRRCRELGIVCVLENKLPHLIFGKTSDIVLILDALDDVEIGACLDTGHGYLSGDVFQLLRKLGGHLKMIHAHDNRGQYDDHLPPGEGSIDWERLLRELVAVGFHGAFILELGGMPDPAVTMANARRGRSFLRGMSRQLAMARP